MTFVFAVSCVLTAFTPASAIFLQVVAKDPLRVILCALGAFFWLVSLLVTSLIWLALSDAILHTIVVSVVLQEVARSIYYFLLHRAQGGLAKLALNGVGVSGLRLLHSSRHILAVVCGLGMGVMSAIFLLLNVIADSSHDGVVGLPASVPEVSKNMRIKLHFEDASFPIFYSLSCSFLILDHICWTISLWDGLHKRINRLTPMWWLSVVFAILSHLLNSAISFFLSEYSFVVLGVEAALLIANCAFCWALVKNLIFASDIANVVQASNL